MELVIDANILMSALISNQGRTFDLIFDERLRLFSPEFLFEEIKKHKKGNNSKIWNINKRVRFPILNFIIKV